MPLSDNALSTEQEFYDYMGVQPADAAERVKVLLNRCSAMVETYLARQLVSRGSITEYHTMCGDSRLLPTQWPVLTVTTVHEDASRTYAAGDLLVVDDDYIVSAPVQEPAPRSELIRVLTGGSDRAWLTGFRAVKLVYTAGYTTREDVPPDIRDAYLESCAWVWSNTDRRKWGITGWSDDAGNFTRVSARHLPDHIKEQLTPHRNWSLFETGQRDAA